MTWENPVVTYKIARRTSEFRKRATASAALLNDHPALQSEVDAKAALLWAFVMPTTLFDISCRSKDFAKDLRRLVALIPDAQADGLYWRTLGFSLALMFMVPMYREEYEKSPGTALVTVLCTALMNNDVSELQRLAQSLEDDCRQWPGEYWAFIFSPHQEVRERYKLFLQDPMNLLNFEIVRSVVFEALSKVVADPVNQLYFDKHNRTRGK